MQNKQETTANLSDDLKFLIACCQVEQSIVDTELILNYISEKDEEQLQNLISLSVRHGILPLVYKTIKELSAQNDTALPHDFLAELKAHYMSISQRNMLMSAELIRIMKLLQENNIEALAFKGPALSQMAYGDITLRQYSDLDILIKQDDIHKITTLLKSSGYALAHTFTVVQEKNWYKHAKDMSLIHCKKGIHIELHWLLLDNDYPAQVDLGAIWADPQSVTINGQKIQTFSNESLFLYLCIHGSKHLWERLEWIKDIDLMIRTQDINWEYINLQVTNSDFKRMLLLGLHLSNTLFQTPLPSLFKQQINNQKWLVRLIDFVVSDWQEHRSMFHNSKAMIDLFPTTKMKLSYLHKVILKPSKSEYRFIDLPKGLYWGYYFVRPYLLVKKYLSKDELTS